MVEVVQQQLLLEMEIFLLYLQRKAIMAELAYPLSNLLEVEVALVLLAVVELLQLQLGQEVLELLHQSLAHL